MPEFHGDPYAGCRPECVLNSDCPRDKACLRSKCLNPCPGTCGENAICDVINHIPMCRCPDGTAGSAFIRCTPVPSTSTLLFLICSPLLMVKTYLQKLLWTLILAVHRLVVQILSAAKSTSRLYVLVCQPSLAPHPRVDQNVLPMLSVHPLKRASISVVVTHVLVLVAWAPIVRLSITVPSAPAPRVSPEIPLYVANHKVSVHIM